MAKKIKLDAKYRYNQGSGRRKKMLIALLILLVLLFLNSFAFSIREVVVTGNEVVSAEEIQEELGLTEGMNMFHFLIGSAFQKMDLNPRIETVDIYVHWPNSLEIQVKERTVVGYVAYMGIYLCLDETGYVVDSTHYLDEDMPVITGVNVQSFTLGEPLNTESVSLSQTIMDVCGALQKYGIASTVVRVDLTQTSDIRLYTERLDVRCGGEEDLDSKIQALARILEETPDAEGILHLEDLEGQVYLEKPI